jgi:hypothetical protein
MLAHFEEDYEKGRPDFRIGSVIALLIAGWSCFVGVARLAGADSESGLFAHLAKGRTVQVTYESVGCFHGETFAFTFRRALALTVEIMEIRYHRDTPSQKKLVARRLPLGTVAVSDDEAAGLDRLLDFYRGAKPAGCTTVDSISLTIRDGKRVISEQNFVDGTCESGQIEGLTLFSDLTDKLLAKPKRAVEKVPDPKVELAKAMETCRALAGYERFAASFSIEQAIVGCVNSAPESLFVDLAATHPGTVDAARWWDPLIHGKPSLTWDDFTQTFAAAEAALAAHPWLKDWKALPGKRSLVLQLQGREIGRDSFDMENIVPPLWRHAGLAGKPAYCLLAGWGQSAWVEIYFSDTDSRALITSTSQPDPAAGNPFDRLDVSWHPRGKAGERFSRYALVGNDGQCHVESYVAESEK